MNIEEMTKSSSYEIDEILIYKVQERGVLFDPKLMGYRDSKVRNKAWEEIGGELGMSGAECRENWAKLRHSFHKILRRRQRRGYKNLGVPASQKWKFEDQMAFLLPYLAIQSQDPDDKCNNKNSPMPEDGITIDESTQSSINLDSSVENTIIENSDTSSVYSSNIDIEKLDDLAEEKEMLQVTSDNEEQTSSSFSIVIRKPFFVKGNENTPDSSGEEEFYLRIAKMAKKLELPDRIKLREKVTNLVVEALMPSGKE